MKILLLGLLAVTSQTAFSESFHCNKGYVAIKRDISLKMQDQGNPAGEMRFTDSNKKRVIITAFSGYQIELEDLRKTINNNKMICLQIDPTVFGNHKLEEYQFNSLSQIVDATFTDHYLSRLFIIDVENPFAQY